MAVSCDGKGLVWGDQFEGGFWICEEVVFRLSWKLRLQMCRGARFQWSFACLYWLRYALYGVGCCHDQLALIGAIEDVGGDDLISALCGHKHNFV